VRHTHHTVCIATLITESRHANHPVAGGIGAQRPLSLTQLGTFRGWGAFDTTLILLSLLPVLGLDASRLRVAGPSGCAGRGCQTPCAPEHSRRRCRIDAHGREIPFYQPRPIADGITQSSEMGASTTGVQLLGRSLKARSSCTSRAMPRLAASARPSIIRRLVAATASGSLAATVAAALDVS
jgi:hypothetical protein